MSSFQSLPAEILLVVAQYLGATYLRARTNRVLLCKAWYSVTQSVTWEVLDLSLVNFEKFVQAPTTIQTFVQDQVKDFYITGSYDSDFTSPSQIGESDSQETWRVAKLRSLLNARNKSLCESLADFSSNFLPHLHRLQDFQLKIYSQSMIYAEVDDTWTDTIHNIISSLPSILTSLTIDKLGPMSRFSQDGRDPHAVCKFIFRHDSLPALKHLRLRIHCICPSLFSIDTIAIHHNLETLVIALDAYSSQLDLVQHTHCCTQPQQLSQLLYDDMVTAGRSALGAGCFPSLKTARVMKYNVQALAIYASDLLSASIVQVPDGIDWDDVTWDRPRLKYDLVLRVEGIDYVGVGE